jgi:hypothetical protein
VSVLKLVESYESLVCFSLIRGVPTNVDG